MAVVRTVLPRKGLIQPQNGAVWNDDGDANWAVIDANVVFLDDLPDLLYECTAGSGLTLNISAGRLLSAGVLVAYAGGTLTMTAGSTNYVYLDPAASFNPAVNTTGFAAGVVPLATVICGSSAITSVTDQRVQVALQYGAVAANQVIAGPASGPNAVATGRFLVADDLPIMVGDSGSGGTAGAVPAPAAGDAAAGKFLKADGTFSVPGAGVESLNGETGALSITAGPGITVASAGTTIQVSASGGAGATEVSLTGQIASIPATNIMTPAADGLFQVSVVQLVASAGTAGTLRTQIGWTDEQGAHSRVIATDLDLTNASDQEDGSAVIRAKTTAPITYTVTMTGATGAPAFDLFINVRAL